MYKNYLKSNHWLNKKREVYNPRFYKCALCNKRYGLELHHITYKNIGNELAEDLIYLCRVHHDFVTKCDKDGKLQKWFEMTRAVRLKRKNNPTYFKKRYRQKYNPRRVFQKIV